MFEALSSLYSRLFGPSVSAETSNEPQQSNTSSQRGFFSGWSITFLFGARASENSSELPRDVSHLETGISSTPKPSLLQRIFPYFFSTQSARNGTPDNGATLTSIISALEEPPLALPETISLYVDASAEGKKVDVKKQGREKIVDSESLNPITQELAETNRQYNKSPKSYIDTYDRDANRGFTHDLTPTFFCSSSITNRNIERPQGSEYTGDITKDPKVIQARKVIDTIAEAIFPDKDDDSDQATFRETLGDNLKGISHQALFASPLLAFMNHPPSDGTCLIQGAVSNADFSYFITAPKEITIKATGIYQNANENILVGSVMNDRNQLEAQTLGFPKDGQNNSTGKITGKISLNIIAIVGDDGTITALRCTSMETSWNAQLKQT